MQMQVEAERRKRAAILESEGTREADINIAEGKRKSRILASGILKFIYKGDFYSKKPHFSNSIEAERQEQINKASGEAAAMLAVADARARGLSTIAKSLEDLVLDFAILKFFWKLLICFCSSPEW